jgi:PKD repeat protein
MTFRVLMVASLLLMAGGSVSAEPEPGSVQFSAAGDYAASANTTAVLNTVNALNDDLHLALGDLSYGTAGNEQAWCDFVTSKVGPGYPFQLLAGNHESNGQNGNINDFSACLPNQLPGAIGTYGRQYYVDVPAAAPLIRFVMISPGLTFAPNELHDYSAGSSRYQWTAQTIDGARAAAIPWVVVGMHRPCISAGSYGCDIGSDLFNLLLSKKVDLVLSGHEHSYQRTKQLGLSSGCPRLTPGTYDADCVSDPDSSLVKGAGTVAATVGTGGHYLYDIITADSEIGYFAATTGANQNPTWGVLHVSATLDSLEAHFRRASGGTFADSFTITRPSSAPNSPPVAAFTSTCSDLSCAFDGTASSDSDGTIVHTWDFGDGSSASGATPSHAYAAAGSYQVTLTVTDDRGATGSATRVVTVANPTRTVFASDQFSRSVASGLGTAPTGGSWTLSTTAANYSVADGWARITTAAGANPAASLDAVSASSVDLKMAFGLDKQPTGSGLYLRAVGRRTSAGAYNTVARVTNTGAVTLELKRAYAGGEASLLAPTVISGLTHRVGDVLNLRLQVVGSSPTTIRARIWKAGTPEPAAWQRSVTDSTTGLQTAGSVGVSSYLSGSATNGPVVLRIDELTATAP